MSAKNQKRIERYRYLITLGFTPIEARAMRDRSGTKIETQIVGRRKSLERTQRADRSENERKQLTRLRASNREGLVSRDGKIRTESDRTDNFERWSGREGFPVRALNTIQEINESRGLDENDSFGYRTFFHMYVEREDMEDAEFITERRDT